MIHAYIGDGKGKTTAAEGLLIRSFGSGKNVVLIAFDKGSSTYKHSELEVFDKLNIKYFITGKERMLPDGSFRFENNSDDIQEAKRGISIAKTIIQENAVDLLVMDEVLCAVTYGLLESSEVLDFLSIVPKKVEVILTGRCSDKMILEKADLITEMKKIRHYFDKGITARKGIEY